jgi:methylated-DNA-[protein]-cysteine S-methyltransferase
MFYNSPAGCLKITTSGGFINEIIFLNEEEKQTIPSIITAAGDKELLKNCIAQLDEYFSGERKNFELPLRQNGTEFQQKVWKELMQIPYGQTISYLRLAKRLGNVKAIRAAASANGRNQLCIVVPCHRVIGSNGSLIGYGGGLPRKKWLLDHEDKYEHGLRTLF